VESGFRKRSCSRRASARCTLISEHNDSVHSVGPDHDAGMIASVLSPPEAERRQEAGRKVTERVERGDESGPAGTSAHSFEPFDKNGYGRDRERRHCGST
jgi:hypothetical protein